MKRLFTIPLIIITGVAAAVLWHYGTGRFALAVSGALILALVVLLIIYRRLIKPVHTLNIGLDLLRAQDFSSRIAPVGERDADRIADMFNSMIDRLKAERLSVRERNRFLDLLIDASPSKVIIFDFDGRVASLNRSASEYFGEMDVIGRRLDEIDHPLTAALNDVSAGEELTFRHGGGEVMRCVVRNFIENGFPRKFVVIDTITREIGQAERSAYEKVIRMMAHEVNNTIAGIIPIFDLVGAMPELGEISEASRSCSLRAEALSKFIASIAAVVKIPQPRLKPVSLCYIISSSLPFLESIAAGRDIKVELSLPEGDEAVTQVDQVLIEQAIVNIVKNAVESIGDKGKVQIALSVEDFRPVLRITDDGHGISPETARSLFTPFFSTKASGRGLGLMFVSEILRSHHCNFTLLTDPETRLTTFTIIFPRCNA